MTAPVPPDLASLVLYRDADLLVLNKPAGITVHRTSVTGPTLEDAFDSLRFGLKWRPGLAHRLDRETSGCLVLGRHPAALRTINGLFAQQRIEKRYWAIVSGQPAATEGRIALPLLKVHRGGKWSIVADSAGQPAATRWRVLGNCKGGAWLELVPETGRTHQLRVHSAAMGWPILGDRRYGAAATAMTTLQLHARGVRFAWGKGVIDVTAPPPETMISMIGAAATDAI